MKGVKSVGGSADQTGTIEGTPKAIYTTYNVRATGNLRALLTHSLPSQTQLSSSHAQ